LGLLKMEQDKQPLAAIRDLALQAHLAATAGKSAVVLKSGHRPDQITWKPHEKWTVGLEADARWRSAGSPSTHQPRGNLSRYDSADHCASQTLFTEMHSIPRDLDSALFLTSAAHCSALCSSNHSC
jgi:hypothetical protein